MARATALLKQRNFIQGTPKQLFSILSYSDKQIKDRAARLGVSLGVTEKHITEFVLAIKKTDFYRTFCMLNKNATEKDIEQPFSLVLNRASALTEDLDDEDFDRNLEGESDIPVVVQSVKRTRRRKDYSCSHKRRSARIKIQNIRKNA